MRVAILCESSGIVRDAFAAKGHEAWSCDLLDTERPGNHFQGDALYFAKQGWDLVVGHPPCTYMSNSGARWLYNEDGSKNKERWENLREAAEFFKALWALDVEHICLENPIMHCHAKNLVGVNQSQVVQPWMFGHGETKATCLWLKNLPLLMPTEVVEGREQRIWSLPPGPDRWKERSKTFTGIAEAMAGQWNSPGNYQKSLFNFAA